MVSRGVSTTGRIVAVEYLRGVAAVSVAWFHFTVGRDNWFSTPRDNWGNATGNFGWLGVHAFFVISGFIIPYSIAKRHQVYTIKDFPKFLVRRLLRIEPPYIASLLLLLLLSAAFHVIPGFRASATALDLRQVAAHFFYLIPLTNFGWLQPVYWTLAYEFAFYVSVGVLFPWIGGQSRTGFIILVLLVDGMVVTRWASPLLLLFVIGFAVFRAKIFQGMDTLLSVGMCLPATAVLAFDDPEVAVVAISTAIIIGQMGDKNPDSLLTRLLVALGAISYSLYLTHIPIGGLVMNLGERFIDSSGQEFALSLAALAISLAFARAFHALIERPAVEWARAAIGMKT